MKTADIKFLQLCNEVDEWKNEANFWKQKYEELLKEHSEYINQSLVSTKKSTANALMLALSMTNDENDNLILDIESREGLIKSWNF